MPFCSASSCLIKSPHPTAVMKLTPNTKPHPIRALLATLCLFIAILCTSQSYAAFNQFSVGLNFGSDDGANGTGARALGSTDIAGIPAVGQANWNNMPGANGTSSGGAVLDNSGNATSVGVTWATALGTYSSGGNNGFVSVPDHTLTMGYIDNGGTATVTITNLPAQLTGSGYDVYVYAVYDTPGRGGTYSIVDGLNTSTVLRAPLPLLSD